MKTVEKPTAALNDGTNDEGRQPTGLMMNAEGEYVIAEPDKASWEQFQAKAKASAAQQEAATASSKELQERGLECPIDKRLFVDPVKTPCCGKTYCNECIENALVNSDLICPNCQKEGVLLDDLATDEKMVASIKAYESEKATARKAKEKSKSPPPINPDPRKDDKEVQNQSATISKTPSELTKSLSPAVTTIASDKRQSASPALSKKRPADAELQNPRSNATPPFSAQQKFPLRSGPLGQNHAAHPNPYASNGMPQQYNAGFMPNYAAVNGTGPSNPNAMMAVGANMGPMMNMTPEMANSMMLQGGVWPIHDGSYQHHNGMYENGYNSEMMNNNGWMGNHGWAMNGMDGMHVHGMNGMNGMSGMNGMNGMNTMNGMNGLNGMNGGMYGMNGLNGMNGMNGMSGMNGMNNMNSMNSMNGMAYPQATQQTMPILPNGKQGGYPYQQRMNFNGPSPSEEDNAYFRKPVNPYRHNNRQRRLRPSEYTEL